jgi:hypothetical protein
VAKVVECLPSKHEALSQTMPFPHQKNSVYALHNLFGRYQASTFVISFKPLEGRFFIE